jgi:2-dehydropantoate 2-reductase
VEAVSARGVGLDEAGQRTWAKNIAAVTEVAQIIADPFDLIIFTMKAYDTSAAARQVAPLTQRGVPILVLQNGVGGEELAAGADSRSPLSVFSAVITLAVEVIEPGLVQLATTRGGISLAPTVPGQPVDRLAELFEQARFRVAIFPDYRPIKWSKLLLNMVGNASVAILGWTPDRVFADVRLFALERAAFREAVAVMRASGMRPVRLPGYPVPILAWGIYSLPTQVLQPLFRRFIVGSRGGKMPSLYLDLARERPPAGTRESEVEFLNGAVVKQGQTVGVATPVNYALYVTLMDILEGRVPWDDFRGQPERLLATSNLMNRV